MFIGMHSLSNGSFCGGQALCLESPLVTYKSLIKLKRTREHHKAVEVPRVDAQPILICRAQSYNFLKSFPRNYMANAGTESQQQ